MEWAFDRDLAQAGYSNFEDFSYHVFGGVAEFVGDGHRLDE
jgi:hypothetical protein